MTKKIIAIVLGLLLITAVVPAQGSQATNLMNTETPDCRRLRSNDLACLACNIYFEARGESVKWQLVVAKVTLNRKNHPEFPSTICKVVWDKHQFTWTSRRSFKVIEPDAWKRSVDMANVMVKCNQYIHPINMEDQNLLYFHEKRIKPVWAKKMVLVATVDKHAVYRQK